jgi:hypothetical protein
MKLLPENTASATLPCRARTLEASLFPVTPDKTEETTPPSPPFFVVVVAAPGADVMLELPLEPADTLIVTPAAPVGTGLPIY